MGGINFDPASVDQYGYIKYFHLDEPVEHGHYPSEIQQIANHILDKQSSSLMMMSSFREPDTYTVYPDLTGGTYAFFYRNQVMDRVPNTRIMCDKYVGWFNEAIDQRPFWTDFRAAYNVKNMANWLSLDKDHDDGQFIDLIGHANSLGINNLWVFGLGSGNSQYIDEFCYAAWVNSWLYRLGKQLVVEWACDSTPCETTCQWPDGNWYIFRTYYTYETWF